MPRPVLSVDHVYRECLRTIRKDLAALKKAAQAGKLSPMEARDLHNYTKLLRDLRDADEKAEARKQRALEKEAADAIAREEAEGEGTVGG